MPDETITFVASYEPPISPGTYTLTVKQKLKIDGIADETYINTKKVLVQGDRFRIDPLAIDSVFPADQSAGLYSSVLPHILFSRKTLLWERNSGVSGDPWLALLIFHADDQGGIPTPKPSMVGDLLRDRLQNPPANSKLKERDSTLESSTATYMDAQKHLDPQKPWKSGLGYGDSIWDPCMVVDVPVALFKDIAPAQEDLRWLAHCRIVNDPAKNKSREFSVIFANRLPKKEGLTAAYLVSLEGMTPFLRKNNVQPSIDANGVDATNLRLVVLKAWSFSSQLSTKHGLGNLKHGDGPLCLPYKQDTGEASDIVENALKMGYTAMDHDTRWGDRTISWYRGPFLPFKSEIPLVVVAVNRSGYAQGHAPISTADQALRYVQNMGMLDISYAAAWQLGRLMALRDTTFSLALFHWKRDIRQKTHAAAEAWALGIQSVVNSLAGVLGRNETGENESRPRHAHAEWRRWVKSIEPLIALHEKTEAPAIIVDWLDKLRKLDGVPLDYLVPDERMLPAESLRYFQVDPNWIYSLVEGAFSVARDTSSDLAHDTALGHCVHYPGTEGYPQLSGFLLRSAAVSDCPGLQVKVDVVGQAGKAPLQFRRLAPDILFCLVEGIIKKVTFPEPPESINFGLESDGTVKKLRKADGAPANESAPVSERSSGKRVIEINGLAHQIKGSLQSQFPNFNSADFALQMLRS
jgi:hypothetical protein